MTNIAPSSFRRIAGAALVVCLLCGCGTLRNGRGWGQDATLLPGASRLGRAARNAASDPYTWAPALGAAAIGAAGLDRRISDWARDHAPLFGSERGADQASDLLVDVSCGGALASALATPSGEQASDAFPAKLKGIALEAGTVGVTIGVTEGIKALTRRDRPDGSDNTSFPSGHTAASMGCASLTRRNLQAIDLSSTTRGALDVGSTVVGAAAGWARVEAGKHYASDVLAGAALANFLAVLSYDAFLGVDKDPWVLVSFAPGKSAPMLVLTFRQ